MELCLNFVYVMYFPNVTFLLMLRFMNSFGLIWYRESSGLNIFVADWLQFGFGFGISATLQKTQDLHLVAKFVMEPLLWILSN